MDTQDQKREQIAHFVRAERKQLLLLSPCLQPPPPHTHTSSPPHKATDPGCPKPKMFVYFCWFSTSRFLASDMSCKIDQSVKREREGGGRLREVKRSRCLGKAERW